MSVFVAVLIAAVSLQQHLEVPLLSLRFPVADAAAAAPYHGGGIQTGSPSTAGSFYSGGITHDKDLDISVVTGIHYNDKVYSHGTGENNVLVLGKNPILERSNCYVGSVAGTKYKWSAKLGINFRSLGNPSFTETCSAVTSFDGLNQFYVVGFIEGGGLDDYKKSDDDTNNNNNNNNFVNGFDFSRSAKQESKNHSAILGTISAFSKVFTDDKGVNRLDFVSGSVFTENTKETNHIKDNHNSSLVHSHINFFYPVSVVTETKDDNNSKSNDKYHYVYVAALTSASKSPMPLTQTETKSAKEQINWNDELYLHDDDHERARTYLTIFKFRVYEFDVHLKTKDWMSKHPPPELIWMAPFPFHLWESNKNVGDFDIGGMILLTDEDNNDDDEDRGQRLVIAGSTNMIAEKWFGGDHTNSLGGAHYSTDDEDGFILVVDPNTGTRIKDLRFNGMQQHIDNDIDAGKSQEYVTDIKKRSDEHVKGICASDDNNNFVVVGSTRGMGTMKNNKNQWTNDKNIAKEFGWVANEFGWGVSTRAFIQKYDINVKPDYAILWLSMPSSNSVYETQSKTEAMDCVIANDEFLYVVGNVFDGGHMIQNDTALFVDSNGEDRTTRGTDVWVAKLDYTIGNVIWLIQVGGDGNDKITHTGKSIVVNNEGNVVVYGDTTSNLYRRRSDDHNSTDVFLMTIDGVDGTIIENDDEPYYGRFAVVNNPAPTAAPFDTTNDDEEEDGSKDEKNPATTNNNDDSDADIDDDDDDDDGVSKDNKNPASTNDDDDYVSKDGKNPATTANNNAADSDADADIDANANGNEQKNKDRDKNQITQAQSDNDMPEPTKNNDEEEAEPKSLIEKMKLGETKTQTMLYYISIVTGLLALYCCARRLCSSRSKCCKRRKKGRSSTYRNTNISPYRDSSYSDNKFSDDGNDHDENGVVGRTKYSDSIGSEDNIVNLGGEVQLSIPSDESFRRHNNNVDVFKDEFSDVALGKP